jgi:hypothetical protein
MESGLPDIVEQRDLNGELSGVEKERQEDERTDQTEILQPYDPDLIDVVTKTPTVDLLLSRLRHGRMDLAPDFQRKAGIWTDVAQSRLIESLLLRIPLPTLYASEAAEERWLVVDGIQRLTSIARFVEPSVVSGGPLKLQRLEYLKQYEGQTFTDLPGRLQTRIRETELVLHLIRLGTPDEVKYNIFARINTGGAPLSAQELRHALIPGPAREELKTLARSPSFINATTGSVRDDRMADREMVLRFVAFYTNPVENYSSQDFDQFLRATMVSYNKLSEQERTNLAALFFEVMKTAQAIFGGHAFRKVSRYNSGRYPINKALFETVSVNLAKLSAIERGILNERRTQVMKAYAVIMDDYNFERSISQGTADPQKVRYRFNSIDRLFRAVLDA